MSVFKQLVIKSLFDCEELQEEIMSFAFMDRIERTRGLKKEMVRDINRNLEYHRGPGGYWILAYKSYTIESKVCGGQVCGQCGNYYASHNQEELMDCIKCKCWGEFDF